MPLVFPVSVTDAAASAVFQTMLTVCHRKRPKLGKQLLKGIMEYLSSRSAAPGVRFESTLVQLRAVLKFYFYVKGEPPFSEIMASFPISVLQSAPGVPQGPGLQPPGGHHHPAGSQVSPPWPLQESPRGSSGGPGPPSHRQLPHSEANCSFGQVQTGGC